MAVGDTLVHSSIIGTEFQGRILAETTVAGRAAIVPAIRGSAWLTGFHTYVLDASDPFPQGYVVADTWGTTGTLTQ
jgi:proline racemase